MALLNYTTTVPVAKTIGDTTDEHYETCPDRYRYRTPLGDMRERAVPCRELCGRMTLAVDARCDACHERRLYGVAS
jgi:hypothetical protein